MSEDRINENSNPERGKSRRGFAVMDRTRHKEIASKGGRAAHQTGVAHKWNSEEAREAGKKGGLMKGKRDSQ